MEQVAADALAAMAAVKATEAALGSAIMTGEKIKNALEVEEARAESAENSAAQLQREVSEAEDKIREQQEVLVKVGWVTHPSDDTLWEDWVCAGQGWVRVSSCVMGVGAGNGQASSTQQVVMGSRKWHGQVGP